MNKRDNALVTPRIRKARIATFAGFMMVGAMMYIWSTGVSAFRAQMGLSGSLGDADFGLIALGIGIGAAAGSLFVGRFIDVFGAKRVIYVAAVVYPLSIIPLGFVSGFWLALSFGVVLGLFRGAVDTAFNAHGVQVERFYRRPIMSAFHAFYSLGGFLLGMVGSLFAARYTESAAIPFGVLGSAMLVIGGIVGHYMLDKDDEPEHPAHQEEQVHVEDGDYSRWSIILLMIGFGVLLLGSMLGESAVADWGQEYVHRELGSTISMAGMAVSVFIGAECLGRLIGDRVAERLGAPQTVGASGFLAVTGLLLTTLGDNTTAWLIGFGLFGLGLACIAPLMLSSAGRKDPANSGRNIGIVNGIGYSGMLLGPAAISTVVNYFGLSHLLYVPMVLLMPLALFGPLLMRTQSEKGTADAASTAAQPSGA